MKPEDLEPSKGRAATLSGLRGLDPREVLRRALAPARLTGGGAEAWEPPSVSELAPLFPGYEVLSLLGRGGMGAVYKARQLSLSRWVAIKLLPLELSLQADFAERFRREAQSLARLTHPNIVGIFDFGQTRDGHFFFAMEFVDGGDLQNLISQSRLSLAQAFQMVRQVCDALEFAHQEGFVHRDVKPANVLIDSKGRVKVSDFGLARLLNQTAPESAQTQTGSVLGTPDYIAPEQAANGHSVDHRADIYSLGVMFYEMLTGHLPRGIFDLPSKSSEAGTLVDEVILRALQNEPSRRYQHASEMRDGLSRAETESQRVKRSPKKPHAILALSVALASLGGGWLFFTRPEQPVTSAPILEAPFSNSLGQRFLPAGTPNVLFAIWETRIRDFEIFQSQSGHEIPQGMASIELGEWGWRREANWRTPAGYTPGPDFPVLGINWSHATAFCIWLTKKERAAGLIGSGDTYRLPSDAEWSAAIGSDSSPLNFPWGGTFPPTSTAGNYAGEELIQAGWKSTYPIVTGFNDAQVNPCAVGSFKPNGFGLYDLGGNALEWVADNDPADPQKKLARGASWLDGHRQLLDAAHRFSYPPETRGVGLGFRIVLARAHSTSPQP